MSIPYLLPIEIPKGIKKRQQGVWVAPVSTRQQQQWGTCFIVWNIGDEDLIDSHKAIEKLAEEFSNYYYPPAAGKVDNRDEQTRIELQLEEVLQYLNRLVAEKNSSLEFLHSADIDLVIGVAHPSATVLSNHRHLGCWFIKSESELNKSQRIEEITDNRPSPMFFSQVVSGAMATGETLIIATPTLFNAWDNRGLLQLIDAADSTELLSEHLENLTNNLRLSTPHVAALMIFALADEDEESADSTDEEVGIPIKSTGPIKLSIVSYSKSLLYFLKIAGSWLWKQTKRLAHATWVRLPFFFTGLKSFSVNLAGWILKFLWAIGSLFSGLWLLIRLGIATVFKDVGTQEELTQALEQQRTLAAIKRTRHTWWSKWTNFTLMQQAIVWGAFIFIILIFLGLAINSWQTKVKEQQITQQQSIDEIKLKTGDIEAKLIYGDDKTAQQLLTETRKLIESLPQDTKQNKEVRISTEQKLEELAKQIRREVQLPSPIAIAKLTETPNQILRVGDRLIVSTPTKLLSYGNLAAASSDVVLPKNFTPRDLVAINNTSFLVLDGKKGLVITLAKKITSKEVSIPIELISPATFNGRLYGLETKQNSIVKLNAIKNGWGTPQPWLKTNTPLDAVSLAIDGSIYIATSQTLYKYYNSEPTPFNFIAEPALKGPLSLKAFADAQLLTLIDQGEKRIILIEKGTTKNTSVAGHVKAQLKQERWNNLKDANIDEKKKLIYVLNGQFIEEYTLPALPK